MAPTSTRIAGRELRYSIETSGVRRTRLPRYVDPYRDGGVTDGWSYIEDDRTGSLHVYD